MGGAADNDDAMLWMLEHSGYGDIVILRTDQSDGYNDYLYNLNPSQSPNSVETFVIDSQDKANNADVVQSIKNAEALFIAGGNQAEYVSYWKNTGVEDAINYLINTKHAPIGGTSAGCAIQGKFYYSAANGTVYSNEALADPYNTYMTVGANDFIDNSLLTNLITDTHYDNPDRRGRHFTFLARMVADYGIEAKGIGVDEYTAVCIEENGIAQVFGDENYEDYAYFLQSYGGFPENCTSGEALTWNNNGQAVKVYKIQGSTDGSKTFDLNTWTNGVGGIWEDWYANNGSFTIISPASAPDGSGGGGETCDTPTNLTTSNITISSAVLSWQSTSADNYILEYKATSENNWNTLTISTTSYTLTNLTAATDYEFRVKSDCGSLQSSFSANQPFTTLTDQQIDYCNVVADSYYEWIRTIEFGDIYNNSGDDYGYADYTNLSTSVNKGSQYSIYLSPGFAGRATTEYWRVYIDFNQDGDFNDTDELVVSKRSRRSISTNITIPSDALTGNTRMRIMMKYGSYPTSCENSFDGEAEDYTINISATKTMKISQSVEFSIYPNPTSSYLFVQVPEKNTLVEIYSPNGQLCKQVFMKNNTIELDLNRFKEGNYIIRTQNGKKSEYKKFILIK